jgi:hypothetical protein
MRRLVRLAVLTLGLLLAACGQTPPADGAATISGTIVTSESPNPVLAVGIAIAEYVEGGGVFGLGLVEVAEHVFVGGVTPVALDGSFTMVLPSADDVEALDLAPAALFVDNANEIVGCTLDASDPAALVTPTMFSFLTAPSLTFFSTDGGGLALATSDPVDPVEGPLPTTRFLTWVYADRRVAVATPDGGCVGVEYVLEVDVQLERGWNQLGWAYTSGPTPFAVAIPALSLRNDDAPHVYALAAFGF